MELKLVLGTKEGKSYQKELKDSAAEALLNISIGDKVTGDSIGFSGYEFLITGGSDKCGFPMRKGIQSSRKKALLGKSIGFSGLDRNDKKQKGLLIKRTVCGERVTKDTAQVNLKVLKMGSQPLGGEAQAEEQKRNTLPF